MKKIMTLALLAGGALAGAAFPAAQDGQSRTPGGDRFRFLYLAVFEGLVEDGIQKETVAQVVDPDKAWFITNCPICNPVRFAFEVYHASLSLQSWVSGDLPPGHGPGLSKEEAVKFASQDVVTRHNALKALVGRFVERRFTRSQMTEEEKNRLREAIKIGMKEGLAQLKAQERESKFPASCPSCEGAN